MVDGLSTLNVVGGVWLFSPRSLARVVAQAGPKKPYQAALCPRFVVSCIFDILNEIRDSCKPA